MVENGAPSNARVFEKRSIFKTDLSRVITFHNDPAVFSKLAPPPIFIQVKEDRRTSLEEGDLRFVLWFGPFPVAWHAQHEPGPAEHSFADRMISGPLAYWRHEHIFEAVEGGVRLTDRITLAHHQGLRGILSRLMFDGLPLQFLVFYRHLRTRWAVERS